MQINGLIPLACCLATVVGAQVAFDVSNDRKTAVNNAVVELNWNDLSGKIPELKPENARAVANGGSALPVQPIDNDGDGKIDWLLVMPDIPAGQAAQFTVVADSNIAAPEMVNRVYARYVPERKDDFSWENDVVAFRAYGPALEKGDENSGIDCFMKRVKYPILDKWYKAEKFGKSYHVDYGEGYDGYKVGASLGNGGTAIWSGEKLYLSEVYRKWRQFSGGPLRASFELTYGPWEVAGQKITETKRITLDYGKRLFKVEDSYFIDGKPAKIEVAVGITTHDGDVEVHFDRQTGILYGWEKIDKFNLGTGVIVPPEIIKDYREIKSKKKYEANAFFVVDTGASGSFTYYAGYGWDRAGEITSREDWENYLKSFKASLADPPKAAPK